MAGKKKGSYKKLTAAQKNMNKRVKKDLIEQGILPPPKKRLNRKEFAIEAKENTNELLDIDSLNYIHKAISVMLPDPENHTNGFKVKITSEEVGVMKLIKLAVEWKRFEKEKLESGQMNYKLDEVYEKVIKPILNL
jgi:hypothetical protein